MFRRFSVLLSLCLTLSALAAPGVVARAKRPVPGSYIVVLKDHDSLRPAARAAELVRPFAGQVTAVWETALHGFAVRLTDAQAKALSHNPFVKSVEENAYASVASSQATDSNRWGLDRIDQHILPTNGFYTYCQDGTGVNIYIVDTGVKGQHDEFDLPAGYGNRVEDGVTTCNGYGCSTPADSPCGSGYPSTYAHGTMVASVAAGIQNGVAKNATIIPVRAGDCRGDFQTEWIISAFDWVDADHQPGEPAVMNCSFIVHNWESDAEAVEDAINSVIDDGVVVVVGAGNDDTNASNTLLPNIEGVITVGASDRYDARWTSSSAGSSYGSNLELFAPGKSIRVATVSSNTAMDSATGTSFAAPFVAGVVAQYLQVNPTATPAQVFSWVVSSATTGVLSNIGGFSPNRLLYSQCN
jgi:subtilisin family serine protease